MVGDTSLLARLNKNLATVRIKHNLFLLVKYQSQSVMSKSQEIVVPGQIISPTYRTVEGSTDTVRKFEAGPGATIQEVEVGNTKQQVITSTLLGRVKVEEIDESESTDSEDSIKDEHLKKNKLSVKKFQVSVVPVTSSKKESTSLPKEGDIVLTRITRLNLKQAYVEILALEGSGNILSDSGVGANGNGISAPGGGSGAATFSIHQGSSDLGETFKGIIRSQDIRSTERDRVKVIESFKPGDIVRAQILSLGDGTNYYLTTARNDLGVVFAKARNGAGGLMYAVDWQTMVCPTTGDVEQRKCAKPF